MSIRSILPGALLLLAAIALVALRPSAEAQSEKFREESRGPWRVISSVQTSDLGSARARYLIWNEQTGETYVIDNNSKEWVGVPYPKDAKPDALPPKRK